jgi:hypothetical protein
MTLDFNFSEVALIMTALKAQARKDKNLLDNDGVSRNKPRLKDRIADLAALMKKIERLE